MNTFYLLRWCCWCVLSKFKNFSKIIFLSNCYFKIHIHNFDEIWYLRGKQLQKLVEISWYWCISEIYASQFMSYFILLVYFSYYYLLYIDFFWIIIFSFFPVFLIKTLRIFYSQNRVTIAYFIYFLCRTTTLYSSYCQNY